MKTKSHHQLHGREFGSALLNLAQLKNWLDASGIVMCPVPEGDFIQVELLLVEIERARFDELTDAEAEAILAATPAREASYADALRSDGLDEESIDAQTGRDLPARWLCSAEAHLQWRRLIRQAVKAGELKLLDCDSKLPVEAFATTTTLPARTPKAFGQSVISETGLSKRERQIAAIVDAAVAEGYAPMSIPDGGKTVLKKICKASRSDLFGAGDDPFKEAWQEALKQNRVRTINHNRYTGSRGKIP